MKGKNNGAWGCDTMKALIVKSKMDLEKKRLSVPTAFKEGNIIYRQSRRKIDPGFCSYIGVISYIV